MVRFRPRRDAVANEVRRVAVRQLDRALSDLRGDDVDVAVHDVRRRIKELRALVRLIRPVAPEVSARQNQVLRDAGRRISEVRDAAASIEALDRLIAVFPSALTDAGARARAGLGRRRTRLDPSALDRALAHTGRDLEQVRAEVGAWEIPDHGFETLAPGLGRCYQRAWRRMRDAYALDTTAAFHDWRKRVKDHRYQVSYLRALSPKVLRAREDALHDLTDLVGDDHDLAHLRGLIGEEPDAFGGRDVVARIIEKIDRRRARLRRDAHRLGARCFADSPGPFVERLRGYWDASVSTPA